MPEAVNSANRSFTGSRSSRSSGDSCSRFPASCEQHPPPPQASATPAGQANYVPGTTAFDDLNKHLAWFVVSKKRFPANVDELLTANRLPKPVLPPGGQLVINQKTKTVDYVGPK